MKVVVKLIIMVFAALIVLQMDNQVMASQGIPSHSNDGSYEESETSPISIGIYASKQ